MTDDELYEQATIMACELDSPNSPDFEALHEWCMEQILTKEEINDQTPV